MAYRSKVEKSMNKLAELTKIIDTYVAVRNSLNKPLKGRELEEYSWLVANLAKAVELHSKNKLIRFHFLYGKLLAAAKNFIHRYMPSEFQH